MKHDDDWMHPSMHSHRWIKTRHADGTFYLISRKKRIPVTGNFSHIEKWDTWQEFDSKEERDAELARLRKTTTWVLRADQVVYVGGRALPGSSPRDLIDV